MLFNFNDIKFMVSECVKKCMLSENKIFHYCFKCSDFQNADYLQELTGYDPSFSSNQYCISDEKLKTKEIEILTKTRFKQLTNNFNFSILTDYPITYYAINNKWNILFAYSEKEDIHYFFN